MPICQSLKLHDWQSAFGFVENPVVLAHTSAQTQPELIFVLEVVPPQRRVGSFFDKKSPKIDVVLYPTYFHSPPPFAHHFPPVPPAPLGRLRPPRADRSRSGFTQGQRGPRVVYAAVYAARAGKHGPP